jgi:hypothetical protein
MWTLNDQRFLRSLRIVADDPAAASPRFVVEPGAHEGEFVVIDRQRRTTAIVFTPRAFREPRPAAEDLARQLNEKHTP